MKQKTFICFFDNWTDYGDFQNEINNDIKDQLEAGYYVHDIKLTSVVLNRAIEETDAVVEYGAIVIYKLTENNE